MPAYPNPNHVNPTAPPAASYIEPDGSLVLHNITVSGTERGRVGFRSLLSFTGQVRVPGTVVAQGYTAIQDWINSSAPTLPGLVEDADEYEYGPDSWERISFTPERNTLTRAMVDLARPVEGTTAPEVALEIVAEDAGDIDGDE